MSQGDLTIQPVSKATRLDWLITACAVWIMTGLFIDAHEHLFATIETFFNPWHLMMYGGAAFAAAVLGLAIARNHRPGRPLWRAIPDGYVPSVFGVAGLLAGGMIDGFWHAVFGFEHQLDLLLSPPHLFLLTGLFFLITGPVRSALRRPPAARLLDQIPMLVSIGLAFGVIQFITQFGFYTEALMRDRPLSQLQFPSEQLVLSVLLYYRQAFEILIVLWQSVLLASVVLYVCARTRLCFGALAIVCVVEKVWIGAELSTDLGEFAIVALAALSAGIAGDVLVARLRPSLERSDRFRILAFTVPAVYFATYFIIAALMLGGTWWNPNFVFGSIVEAGLVGVCMSQLFIAGSQSPAPA